MRAAAAAQPGRCSPSQLQVAIGDRQFIVFMIPHHSGAILMCREARIQDAELVQLCNEIKDAQRREIEQMNAIRARLESKPRTPPQRVHLGHARICNNRNHSY